MRALCSIGVMYVYGLIHTQFEIRPKKNNNKFLCSSLLLLFCVYFFSGDFYCIGDEIGMGMLYAYTANTRRTVVWITGKRLEAYYYTYPDL